MHPKEAVEGKLLQKATKSTEVSNWNVKSLTPKWIRTDKELLKYEEEINKQCCVRKNTRIHKEMIRSTKHMDRPTTLTMLMQ